MIFVLLVICFILGALFVLMMRAEFILFPEVRDIVRRVKAILPIIEGHSKTNDAVGARVVDEVRAVKRDTVQAAVAAKQAAVAIAEVPKKVREELAGDSVNDSAKLPVVKLPPPGSEGAQP